MGKHHDAAMREQVLLVFLTMNLKCITNFLMSPPEHLSITLKIF
jgi:hypothetical protein